MAKQMTELIVERERELQQQYEEKLDQVKNDLEEKMEKSLEKHREKIQDQISVENDKLIKYIAATREEEKKKSIWSKLFNK